MKTKIAMSVVVLVVMAFASLAQASPNQENWVLAYTNPRSGTGYYVDTNNYTYLPDTPNGPLLFFNETYTTGDDKYIFGVEVCINSGVCRYVAQKHYNASSGELLEESSDIGEWTGIDLVPHMAAEAQCMLSSI